MLYYLKDLADKSDLLGFLRLFQWESFRAAGACLTAFFLSLAFGNKVILRLTALKLGQPIRTKEEVHKLAELHGGKGGTPTMGGVLIVGTVLISSLLWAVPTNPFVYTTLFVFVALAALGFADDLKKVRQKKSAGVNASTKLTAQILIGLIAIGALYLNPDTSDYVSKFYLPFLKTAFIGNMGWFTLVVLTVIIVGASNAVNLTDGLDGLAIGCTATTTFTYALFTYLAGKAQAASYLNIPHCEAANVAEVSVLCTSLGGAALGFLWFNCHPARVFIVDTGSLAIGGMLAMVAIACRQEVLLAIVGFVFVAEALSVILQVGSFKLRGKRIFKMAPIHHHFELMGWKETKVISRFWIISIIAALVGLMTLKIR
ncbi:MAG: phospho-N-acetylmuramoyl-pentapeptide-transferase [Verrucomicrobiales bacterium]|nr:phospho-N-acetylmuramoyl-pentapeptide-transferase [Verrucomicrobiales bacterium]